ncbi:MAG: hypothetical protein ACRYG7_26335 [Janthinobacterium lividum]
MKKSLFLLAALAFASASPSFAQLQVGASQTTTTQAAKAHHGGHRKHAKTPEQRADHGTTMLTKKLSLTAAQQPQVHQILLAQAQEGQALRAQYPAKEQRQARRQAMQAGRAKYQAQLQGVLSADQYGKLQALHQEHQHKGEHGGKRQDKS